MQVPAGILVDIFGPRILLAIGSLFAGIACITFSSCKYLWIAKSSRLLMGLVCSPGIVSVFYLVSKWFEANRFAFFVGLTETIGFAGTAIGTILLSATVLNYGWRIAILLCGFAGIAIFLIILFVIRNKPNDNSLISNNLKKIDFKEELTNLQLIASNKQVWINGLYTGLAFSVIPAFFCLWGIPFYMDKYYLTSVQSASSIAIGLLGAGIGGPFLGWLSDYIQRRKIIMIVGSFCAAICGWIILYMTPSLHMMFLLNFILGFSVSGYVLAFAVIKEILPENAKGKAMGFANMLCLLVGAPILQPIIAHLIHGKALDTLTFKIALTPLPIALSLSLILSFFIKETYCKDCS